MAPLLDWTMASLAVVIGPCTRRWEESGAEQSMVNVHSLVRERCTCNLQEPAV